MTVTTLAQLSAEAEAATQRPRLIMANNGGYIQAAGESLSLKQAWFLELGNDPPTKHAGRLTATNFIEIDIGDATAVFIENISGTEFQTYLSAEQQAANNRRVLITSFDGQTDALELAAATPELSAGGNVILPLAVGVRIWIRATQTDTPVRYVVRAFPRD